MKIEYDILQLKDNLSSFKNNSYIIIDKYENDAAIVDPAWNLDEILKIITKYNIRLKAILLTHSHYDHTNLVIPLVERFHPKVFMSKNEVGFYNYHCKNLYEIQDMDMIELGKTFILCILTPGHTAGGMCYYLSGSLFTGDTIFMEGCGICNSYGGCPEKMYESLQKIKKLVHLDTSIYPGHTYDKKPGCLLKDVMKSNIYFQLDNKEYFVDFRMRKGQRNLFNFK